MTETNTGLREGQKMFNFELPEQGGLPYGLFENLRRGPVVLVFYRGDWWPYCNGQLVSYARSYQEFQDRGFTLAGISVDPPSRSAAMVEKLDLPFPLLSDPRGELIKRLGLWNEKEGVSEPAIVILDRSGTVRHLYSGGGDFSDRPPEESLLKILDEVGTKGEPDAGEPEIQVSAAEAENETVRPDRPAMKLEQLGPYYLGTYYATIAMKKKLKDSDKSSYEKVNDYQKLVNEYSTAIQETTK